MAPILYFTQLLGLALGQDEGTLGLEMVKLKVAIDTNLINARGRAEGMDVIENWHKEGLIEIIGTERLRQECNNDFLRKAKAKNYRNIHEPWILGKSYISTAYPSSTNNGPDFHTVWNIIFPNKEKLVEKDENDIMHILSVIHGRTADCFITNDSHFLDKKDELKAIGVKVFNTSEFIDAMKEKIDKSEGGM